MRFLHARALHIRFSSFLWKSMGAFGVVFIAFWGTLPVQSAHASKSPSAGTLPGNQSSLPSSTFTFSNVFEEKHKIAFFDGFGALSSWMGEAIHLSLKKIGDEDNVLPELREEDAHRDYGPTVFYRSFFYIVPVILELMFAIVNTVSWSQGTPLELGWSATGAVVGAMGIAVSGIYYFTLKQARKFPVLGMAMLTGLLVPSGWALSISIIRLLGGSSLPVNTKPAPLISMQGRF